MGQNLNAVERFGVLDVEHLELIFGFGELTAQLRVLKLQLVGVALEGLVVALQVAVLSLDAVVAGE